MPKLVSFKVQTNVLLKVKTCFAGFAVEFHYRSRGRDGHRILLHRGDTITFTCGDEFSIRFVRSSPFEESMPQERKLLIAAHVR